MPILNDTKQIFQHFPSPLLTKWQIWGKEMEYIQILKTKIPFGLNVINTSINNTWLINNFGSINKQPMMQQQYLFKQV